MYYFMDSGPIVHRTCFAKREGGRSRSLIFPIFDIFSSSGDICDESRKLCKKIAPNFACFWPEFF